MSESVLTEPISKLTSDRQLSVTFDVENQKVIGDEKILKNVLRRLLHNAAKFADAKSGIAVRGKSGDDGLYHIEIENSGPAIDPLKVENLLKPFTLNENTMNHSVGTGLGLSICNALLKLHSSRIHLKSRKGKIVASFTLGLDPDSMK